jgi:hypothetical protein
MSELLRQISVLRAGGAVADELFGRLYPDHIAALAPLHWTPVAVALRAAQLLAPGPGGRVLDLGAGPGKLCIIGALSTSASFTGVEHRRHLVRAAVAAAERCGARSARFIHADIFEIDWRPYDACYLFNPFAEYLQGAIDQAIEIDPRFYGYYVDAVTRRLALARPGTRVVTYHGFGGRLPAAFRLVAVERAGTDELELWIRDDSSGSLAA